jgi:hypothetical protein
MQTYIQETIERVLGDDETVALADGFETAFVGIARQFNQPFAVYEYEKCLAILEDQGLTMEEALEHMSYNVEGAWVGESTPAFLHRAVEDWEIERCRLLVSLTAEVESLKAILRLVTPFVSPANARSEGEIDLCLEIMAALRKIEAEDTNE